MAFKIESLQEMTRIAARVSERKEEMTSVTNNISSGALTELRSNISGYGVETNLAKLSDAVITNCNKVNLLLDRVANFITSQVGTYTMNESEAQAGLNSAQQMLNNIQN